MLVVADLGGSNTDLLLASADGRVIRSAIRPAMDPSSSPEFLAGLLEPLRVSRDQVTGLTVTGGRHRRLEGSVDGLAVQRIDEIEAIGRGGLVASGRERALIVSMGTGTAFVSADGRQVTHAAGVALGGGTLRGLAGRLLGTTDPVEIAMLAAEGNPRGPDLTIADIVGGDVGILPGDMPASYLARLADQETAPADLAAAILDMIGHIATHMALLTARIQGHDTIVLIGHMAEFRPVERAARRLARAFGGEIVVPPEPGLAVARGALDIATQAG